MRGNDQRAHAHPAWWAYFVHRVSGLALAVFLPLHFWALSSALRGTAGLDGFLRFADRFVRVSRKLLIGGSGEHANRIS